MNSILLALLAAFAYALDSAFLAPIYRSTKGVVVVSLRGLTHGLLYVPIIYFFADGGITPVFGGTHTSFLFLIIAFSALGNYCLARAVENLPVAFAIAAALSSSSICAIFLDFFIHGGSLTTVSLCLIVVLLILVVWFSWTQVGNRSAFNDENVSIPLGCFGALGFGIFLGSTYFLIGGLSKSLDPLALAFVWELGVGCICVPFVLISGKSVIKQMKDRAFEVLYLSSPGVLASVSFLMATSLGNETIATALLSTQVLFSAIVAHFFLKERIGTQQLIIVVIISFVLGALTYTT